MRDVKIRMVVEYGGHNCSANGSVNLTVKAMYSELVNTIQLQQMLNNDVTIKAKMPSAKPVKLGMFRIASTTIDGDGESKIKFNGINDYIEMDNLNLLPTNKSDDKQFVILVEAEIEEEDDEDGEE
ncbi:MAG: hypothetical protein KBT03_03485 [Bacteroidales bacterium]|nr:hypothetical protein [Candidatus Scybalousia scybalohippi]